MAVLVTALRVPKICLNSAFYSARLLNQLVTFKKVFLCCTLKHRMNG